MAQKKDNGPPTELELYCVILAYLARKPMAACRKALAPQALFENGQERTEAILVAEYGEDLVQGCKRLTAVIVDALPAE